MNEGNEIIKLCQEGMKMERRGKLDGARDLFMKAWNDSSNSYESCVAAHFVARAQDTLKDTLHWDKESLKLADKVEDGKVETFYPSLYLCVGLDYEKLGNYTQAQKYLYLASEKVGILEDNDYGKGVKKDLSNAMKRISKNLVE